MTIVFFGSFQSYSTQVLKKLIDTFSVISVVTTPPKPAGRHMNLKPTEVALFARSKNIPIYELSDIPKIPRPDFIVVAGYGKLIPSLWLEFPKIMAVNMHPSLLPHYRGAMPAEWAILNGEKETGITLVKMSSEFDMGEILVQKKLAIDPIDTRETLYKKLYDLGGDTLIDNLPTIQKGKIKAIVQPKDKFFYARRITRDDGFVPWEEFSKNIHALDQKLRALTPWPGVWTMTPDKKRLKLVSLSPPMVQFEGKKPTLLTDRSLLS